MATIGVAVDEPTSLVAIDDAVTEYQEDASPERLGNRSIDVGMELDEDPVILEQEFEQGDNSKVQQAKQTPEDPLISMVRNTLTNLDTETATDILLNTQTKKSRNDALNDFFYEGKFTVDDPRFSPIAARVLINQQIAYEEMTEAFKAEEDRWAGGYVMDGADYFLLRYIPIGMVEDITGRTTRKGEEHLDALVTKSPEEMRSYAKEYAQELASEGFFTSDNWFALQQGLTELESRGYDPDDTFKRVLGVVDAATLGASAPFRRAAMATSRVAMRAALEGPQKAAQVAGRLTANPRTLTPTNQTAALPGALRGSQPPSGANVAVANQPHLQMDLINSIQDLYSKGSFGREAPQSVLDSAAGKIAEDVKEAIGRPYMNWELTDPTGVGDWTSRATFGKANGSGPFKSESGARQYARSLASKHGYSAKPVELDTGGWVVQVDTVIPTAKLEGSTGDLTTGIRQAVLNVFGNASNVQTQVMNEAAYLGEGGANAIREAARPFLKKLDKLNTQDQRILSSIYTDLRDGPDAWVRKGYTRQEFDTKWSAKNPTGAKATDAQWEAYLSAQALNDAAYFLKANRLADKWVSQGYKVIETPGGPLKAKLVDEFEGDVIDARTGAVTTDLDGKVIFQTEDGTNFVNPPKVREIQYADVLGYNAGGRRVNPDARYFVVLGKGRGRALLSAFSEKQANLAVSELRNIQTALKSTGKKLDQLTDELDSVIVANNKWNPNIESTQDLKDLMKKQGTDLEDDINPRARDKEVDAEEGSPFKGLSYNEYVSQQLNRNDAVLPEFGGTLNSNGNPIQAIANQLSSTAQEYAFANFNNRAKVSWLKKAGYGKDLDAGADVDTLFANAKVNIGGSQGRQLESLRDSINVRTNVRGPTMERIDNALESLEEFVFDTFGKKTNIPRADDLLLNIGFRSAFGFFNMAQLPLQASHSIVIAAVSNQGAKAGSMVIPLRMAMKADNPEGYKRFAKLFGMTAKEAEEIADFVRASGRHLVEADAIEKGTSAGFDFSFSNNNLHVTMRDRLKAKAGRALRAADRAQLWAFNEGERLTRYTSMLTSVLEYKKMYPGKSLFTDDARGWIATRDQTLSLNMTTASRGLWQSGLMKVPTQWLGHSMRVMEAMTIGRQFTKMERARMGLGIIALTGTAGIPMGQGARDYFSQTLGVDPEGVGYALVNYGLMDGIMSWAFSGLSEKEIRTAFGSRLAPFDAITGLWEKVTEGQFTEVAGGPSGQIVGGFFGAFAQSMVHLYGGQREMALKDMAQWARTPSGVDNIAKGVAILREGGYRSKSGTAMPVEFNEIEGILRMLGVNNLKEAEFYKRSSQLYGDKKDFDRLKKDLSKDFSVALGLLKEDPARGQSYIEQIDTAIQLSGLSPYDQIRLRREVMQARANDLNFMLYQLMVRDKDYAAEVLEGLQ